MEIYDDDYNNNNNNNMEKAGLMDQLSFTMGQCRIISKRPIYSGNVTLIIRKKNDVESRTTVFMKLFEQCPKHYAVLFRKDDCEFQYGFFDYRNCVVKPVPGRNCQFDVTRDGEASGLRFEASSSDLAEKWMEAFRCNKFCPYSPGNLRRFGTPKNVTKQRDGVSGSI